MTCSRRDEGAQKLHYKSKLCFERQLRQLYPNIPTGVAPSREFQLTLDPF